MNINKIVYIGDSPSDLIAAREAGLSFIGITSGLTLKETFIELGARQIIDDLCELPTIISDA